ncbi:MAG: VWA domain-containing protein [Methyloversatilis sp.]|uniref:VWA domain-containing protein n=2 Tax=Sterolibacteriaceae TaxID=2008793 RepID=UPI0025F45B1F|nr:VWA domain-containing protein [Methyloversatilis sp.]MCR6667987.1 VWA domain-containing protein [Methyloversatilis sp.]
MNDLVLNLWPGALELTAPLWLLALPLALLPLWPRRRHSLDYGCIDWLPRDALGNAVLRGGRIAAALAIVAAVLGLAGLAQPATEQQRTGRGAEIVIVLDRSRSMDEPLLPKGRQPSIDTTAEAKGKVARRLLAEFAARRPEDRYSLLLFSSSPMLVVPFTQHGDVVQAGIEAGGIGRGLSETDIGRALLAGAEQFDRRAYSGSRILLLVSDGAAQIDDEMRGKIRRAFERNRVAVLLGVHPLGAEPGPERGRERRQRAGGGAAQIPEVDRCAVRSFRGGRPGGSEAGGGRGRSPAEPAARLRRTHSAARFFGLVLRAGPARRRDRTGLPSDHAAGMERGVAVMKLRSVASLLAAGIAVSVAVAAWEGYRLSKARDFNRLVDSGIDAAATQDTPQAEFARALSLAARNDYEGAVRAYKDLSRSTDGDLLQSVLYNLGNLHLREALQFGPESIGKSLPLAELAKSSYRELLRLNPQHWDAKYNLERALRLAPERESAIEEGPPLPQNSERAVTTMKAFTLGLP